MEHYDDFAEAIDKHAHLAQMSPAIKDVADESEAKAVVEAIGRLRHATAVRIIELAVLINKKGEG